MQRRQRPGQINLENRAVPRRDRTALRCRAVEAAVASLRQPARRSRAVGAVEEMKRRQRSGRIDSENCAVARRTAGSRSVEAAVASLNQPTERRPAAGVVEAMGRRQRSCRIDLEDGAVTRGAAIRCCAVHAVIAALDQAIGRKRTVNAVREAMERRQRPRRIDLEDRTVARAAVRAARACCAVEAAVASLRQPAGRRTAVSPVEAMEGRQRP